MRYYWRTQCTMYCIMNKKLSYRVGSAHTSGEGSFFTGRRHMGHRDPGGGGRCRKHKSQRGIVFYEGHFSRRRNLYNTLRRGRYALEMAVTQKRRLHASIKFTWNSFFFTRGGVVFTRIKNCDICGCGRYIAAAE